MHQILERFLLGGNPGDGRLARMDVRVKLILTVVAVLAVVLATRVWLPLAMFACCLVVLTAFHAPLRLTLHRFIAPLGIAAMICLLQAVMTGHTPLWSLPVGPWRLVVTREGLRSGALIAARVLGSIGPIIVLCTFTHVHEIFVALRWAKLPRTWLEIALLMVRSIFILFEQAASVMAAQKVRLGHATSAARSVRSAAWPASSCCARSIRPNGPTRP